MITSWSCLGDWLHILGHFVNVHRVIIDSLIQIVIILRIPILLLLYEVLWNAIYQLHVLVVQLNNALILAHILTGLGMTAISVNLRDDTAHLTLASMLLVMWGILSLIVIAVTFLLIIINLMFYLRNTLRAGRWFEFNLGFSVFAGLVMSIISNRIWATSIFTSMPGLQVHLVWLMYRTRVLASLHRVYLKCLSLVWVCRRCYLVVALYGTLSILRLFILLD